MERLQAAEYAGRFFDREGIEVHIDTYAGGRELLESGREYDLYLLDVLMPGMSGIDTAQALAEDKDHPVVVFITSVSYTHLDVYKRQILDHPMNVLPQLGYGEEKTEE